MCATNLITKVSILNVTSTYSASFLLPTFEIIEKNPSQGKILVVVIFLAVIIYMTV